MLTLSEIRSFFPEFLHSFPRFMLREYLQYKILEIVFSSKYSNSLCFLGGTCLRIIHGNRRFSEDLDFDNTGLGEEEFSAITVIIEKQLEREGYSVEIKTVIRGAWHCYIRFPELLFDEGLSGHREEKIFIQLDTEPQDFVYEPERMIINRFDVFTAVLTTPLSLLLSQKLYAIINRERNKGRDFYDVMFLLGKEIRPNYEYLQVKAGITNAQSLKRKILKTCRSIDMESMAQDVEPFLFDSKDQKKVLLFEDYCKQLF